MDVRYYGWSGLAITCAGATAAVDLFGEAVSWETLPPGPLALCVTHGHPEHCGQLRELLVHAPPTRLEAVHVVSSSAVIDHLMRDGAVPAERAHRLLPGDCTPAGAVVIDAFSWRHLPLLPPESLAAKGAYASSLLRHPLAAFGIGLSALRLPMRAPCLGFRLTFADGQSVLVYAEGLHRLTNPAGVERVATELWAGTVAVAVEPEDTQAIPRWLEILRPHELLIYEAHRPWRELFGLPHVELDRYAEELRRRFPWLDAHSLTRPGQRLRLHSGSGQ